MALEAEHRLVGPGKALQRAVEERHVRHAHVGRQRRGIDGEAVILARDQHLSGVAVEHRMIRAVMSEFHLERAATRREAQQLVTEADAEHRQAGRDDFADGRDGVVAGLRIARAVRQEHAVRLHRQDLARRHLCRHDRKPAAARRQHAQYVVLDAVVVRDHVETRRAHRTIAGAKRPRARRPRVRRRAGDDLREIKSRHRRRCPRVGHGIERGRVIEARTGGDAPVLRAALAQDARELARVDVGNADDVAGAQVGREVLLRTPARRESRQIADDQPRDVDALRFDVFGVDADIADVRAGQRHDLAGIRGVRQDFLVTGHRRVEHDLAHRGAGRTDRMAAEQRAVGEREERRHRRREQRGGRGYVGIWRVHGGFRRRQGGRPCCALLPWRGARMRGGRTVDVEAGKADSYHRPSPLHSVNCTAKQPYLQAREAGNEWSMRGQYDALNPPST